MNAIVIYESLTGNTWKLVGIGTVRNPTGPGSAPVVRTLDRKEVEEEVAEALMTGPSADDDL